MSDKSQSETITAIREALHIFALVMIMDIWISTHGGTPFSENFWTAISIILVVMVLRPLAEEVYARFTGDSHVE